MTLSATHEISRDIHFRTSVECKLTDGFTKTEELNLLTKDVASRALFDALKYLNISDLGRCARINKFFHRLVHGKISEDIWKGALVHAKKSFEMEALTKNFSAQTVSGIHKRTLCNRFIPFIISEDMKKKYPDCPFGKQSDLYKPFDEHERTAFCQNHLSYFLNSAYGVYQYEEKTKAQFIFFNRVSNEPISCFAEDKHFFYLGHENSFVTCWTKDGTLSHKYRHRYNSITRILTCQGRLIVAMTKDNFDGITPDTNPFDSTISIWNVQTKKMTPTHFFEECHSELLATDGTTLFCPFGNKVALINLSTGQVNKTIDMASCPTPIMQITCSKSFEGGAAFGTINGTVLVLRAPISDKNHIIAVRGHKEAVVAVDVRYPLMLSATQSQLLVWDLSNRKALATSKFQDMDFIQSRTDDFLVLDSHHIYSVSIDPSVYDSIKKKSDEDTSENLGDEKIAAEALVSFWGQNT